MGPRGKHLLFAKASFQAFWTCFRGRSQRKWSANRQSEGVFCCELNKHDEGKGCAVNTIDVTIVQALEIS